MIFPLVLLLALWGMETLAQNLCLNGDFDSQVQWFVDNVMLSTEDEAQIRRVIDDVKASMQRRWPGTKVIPFGSAAIGVGIKSSDADCYVKIPNFNTSAALYVLSEASTLLQQLPDVFSNITCELVQTSDVSPLLTFRHKPTGRFCDVTFTNDSIYQASVLNQYFFNLNAKFKPLVAIIKYWFQVNQLNKKINMRSFHLYLLTILYLQQVNMLPPVFALQRRNFNGIWDQSFDEIPYNSTNTDSLYQLLSGFFTYYSEFNFKDYIVSPYAGLPIRKSDFLSKNGVSEIFYLYKKNIRETDLKPLDLDSDMCIQNMFAHNLNDAAQVTRDQAALFVSQLKLAARLSKELPRDLFLQALITNSHDKEQLIESNLNNCNSATDVNHSTPT